MSRIFILLLIGVTLAGCSAEPEQNVPASDMQSASTDEQRLAAQELAGSGVQSVTELQVAGVTELEEADSADIPGLASPAESSLYPLSADDQLSLAAATDASQLEPEVPTTTATPDSPRLDKEAPILAVAADLPIPYEVVLKPLDLSLYYNPAADYWFANTPVDEAPKQFDARGLFEPKDVQKDSEFSISLSPSFKEEQDQTELTTFPEIDGGTVNIEVKTK